MIQMVRFEIKKMLSKTGGKIALVMIFLIVVIVSVFAVRSVDFVKSDGSSITGIRAAKELRYMKSAWTGYLTEDVFAEVIRLNAEVEETPEAQSKDWHESNKAYAMKQGYLDIRDIINSALSVGGKMILPPHGKEFFTRRGKQFFTLPGKEFFTSSGKQIFT